MWLIMWLWVKWPSGALKTAPSPGSSNSASPASTVGASIPDFTTLGTLHWGPSSWSMSFLHYRIKTGCSNVEVVWQVLCRGNKSLPWSTGSTSVDTAENTVSLHHCQAWLLAHVWPMGHQDTWDLPSRAVPWPASTSSVQGNSPCQVQGSPFVLAKHHKTPVGQSGSLWMAALPLSILTGPLSLALSLDFLRVHNLTSSRLSVNVLNIMSRCRDRLLRDSNCNQSPSGV